jgi:hypothetical protein
MSEARILSALKRELDEIAHQAMGSPVGRDAFEYGRVTGMYAGLQRAVEVVEMAIGDRLEEMDGGIKRHVGRPIY